VDLSGQRHLTIDPEIQIYAQVPSAEALGKEADECRMSFSAAREYVR